MAWLAPCRGLNGATQAARCNPLDLMLTCSRSSAARVVMLQKVNDEKRVQNDREVTEQSLWEVTLSSNVWEPLPESTTH